MGRATETSDAYSMNMFDALECCVYPFLEDKPVMRTVPEGKNMPLPVPRKKHLLVFVSNAPIDLEGIVCKYNQSTVSTGNLFELIDMKLSR